ncbi:MAG: ATP-binding protein [Pseudomonadota bacterium]
MNDINKYEQVDRRTSVRRKEDYFWLKRLADLTGEACLAVNKNMQIEFIDDKVFDLLQMTPVSVDQIPSLGALTAIMARQGYFGQGDPKMFEALISDMLTNQRLKQTRATQIINAVTPTGSHVDIRVSLGRDDGFLILMRDITQEELRRRALNTALEIGDSGYWHYNLKTKEFQVTADFLQEFYSPETFEALKQEGFRQFTHPDDIEKTHTVLKRVSATCMPEQVTIRIVGDRGDVRWIKSNVMPNVDEGGRARSLSCFFTDITRTKEKENALKAAQKKAEAALNDKNAFLGRMSHEVRTPLNAVVGMADALVQNCDNEEVRSQLALIQNSAEKVIDLVDGTLEHAKLSEKAVSLDLAEVSPRQLVNDVYRTWKPKADADGTLLTCNIHDNVPETLKLDSYRYEQCLNNLISNALKFSKGGKVQIVLATANSDISPKLVLAVKDTGIGMSKDALDHIFDPFQQADNSISGRFGGTGLGLSIVKDLVDLMGGTIKVSSELGKGTLFAITLPTQIEAAPAQKTYQEPRAPHKGNAMKVEALNDLSPTSFLSRKPVPPQPVDDMRATSHSPSAPQKEVKASPFENVRVLIVDDNATNHIVASSLLSPIVKSIDTALNGEEALEKLQSEAYDLVLMDIHMPVMDGIETTLAIRSTPSPFQHIPIVALTADPQYQQTRLCRNIGMNASLGKPIKLAGLTQAFEDVLFGEARSISPAAA